MCGMEAVAGVMCGADGREAAGAGPGDDTRRVRAHTWCVFVWCCKNKNIFTCFLIGFGCGFRFGFKCLTFVFSGCRRTQRFLFHVLQHETNVNFNQR